MELVISVVVGILIVEAYVWLPKISEGSLSGPFNACVARTKIVAERNGKQAWMLCQIR